MRQVWVSVQKIGHPDVRCGALVGVMRSDQCGYRKTQKGFQAILCGIGKGAPAEEAAAEAACCSGVSIALGRLARPDAYEGILFRLGGICAPEDVNGFAVAGAVAVAILLDKPQYLAEPSLGLQQWRIEEISRSGPQ